MCYVEERKKISDIYFFFVVWRVGVWVVFYFCSAHNLTVGWGHVLSNAEKIELLYTLPITPDLKYGYVQVLYENADIKKILELDEFLEQQKFKFNVSVLTKFLLNDLAKVERCINDARVPLSQNQYDALVSFTFNVGCNAFLNSTLLKKMRNNDYDANEILRWNKSNGKVIKGLTERRKREMRLFANGCYVQ